MANYAHLIGIFYVTFIGLIVAYYLLKVIIRLLLQTSKIIRIVLFNTYELEITKGSDSEFVFKIKRSE